MKEFRVKKEDVIRFSTAIMKWLTGEPSAVRLNDLDIITDLLADRDDANAEIKRLSAENEWFRNAQGVRDAEDERTLNAYKAECEQLRGDLELASKIAIERLAALNQLKAENERLVADLEMANCSSNPDIEKIEAYVERLKALFDDMCDKAKTL
jgi:hypothetical protein